MIHLLAAVFFDEMIDGWRYHIHFSTFDVISSLDEPYESHEESARALQLTVASILINEQKVQVHYVIFESYADYEVDLWGQSMLE